MKTNVFNPKYTYIEAHHHHHTAHSRKISLFKSKPPSGNNNNVFMTSFDAPREL